MDFKTLLDNAQNRRSLLKGMGVAAVGLTFTGALAGCGEKEAKKLANGEEAKLNFYNWDTYIGETTLGDFKGASGIDVNMSLFATNDELFAKLGKHTTGKSCLYIKKLTDVDLAVLEELVALSWRIISNKAFNWSTDTGRQISAMS